MNMEFFQDAIKIIDKIEASGYEAFIVGGAVRDFQLHREIHDIDIATSAPTSMIKAIFPKTVDMALKHGTVIVRYKNQLFEVTTYRGSSLREDLRMRDFTINAMALTKTGKIIDYFDGQRDLRDNRICCVEDASARFNEDPLRIMRAFRFVSELGFSIEKSTFEKIQTLSSRLENVAIERVRVEFEKICLGDHVEKAWELLLTNNVIDNIPQFAYLRMTIKNEVTLRVMMKLTSQIELWSILVFLSRVSDPQELLRYWKLSRKVIDEVISVSKSLPEILEKGISNEKLYSLGFNRALIAERLSCFLQQEALNMNKIHKQYELLPIKHRNEIKLDGNDLIELLGDSFPKAKIGQILTLLEHAIITGKVENEFEKLVEWLEIGGYVNAK